MTHLHGIPFEQWIGRMVKCNTGLNKRGSLSRNPAKIISFGKNGDTVTVHPSGHKRTEEVSIDSILPWWSRNNDLRKTMKPNIEIFHHLPVERFFGRRIKASLGDRGVCVVTLDAVKGDKFAVHWLVRGARKEEWVNNVFCTPNWSENQDLFQESMMAKTKKPEQSDGFGITPNSFGKALDVAIEASKPTEVVLPEKPLPLQASVEKVVSDHPVPKLGPITVQRHTDYPFTQPIMEAHKKIKQIVVNIDADPAWSKDFEELQKTIKAESVHREAIAAAQKALADHDGLVQLCVDSLTEKGVQVIWEGTPVFQTTITIPRSLTSAGTTPDEYLGKGSTERFIKKIKELMEPGIRYTGMQIAEMVGIPFNKTFQNRLGSAMKTDIGLFGEFKKGFDCKFYYFNAP